FDLERMGELEIYTEHGPHTGYPTLQATAPQHPYVKPCWPPGHSIGYEHTFTHTVLDFLLALDAGSRARPDFQDGLANQRVLDAIERSHASRRWERV
ncbi:MAG: gfo/Idh/MocA family oxidoreductase, partial [Proteobacteria bacterium]|nr:gfo/Idh/MocA family oxidoreductase [Pseudomonadota bacterium]